MRRSASLLLVSTFVLAACGGSDSSEPIETSATTDAPAASEPPETDPPATDPPATDPPATDPPATDSPPTDPPALAELPSIGLGDYGVGVQTITVTDTVRDRPLTVDVWFPLAAETTGDPHRYSFITGDYYESPNAITADAASISPDGPFPLIVYSHGSGGTRYIHSNYTETLASHGYVVVAPDHTGNTAVERVLETSDPGELIAFNRPQDVITVIDAMVNPESSETVGFVASVDPEHIAVTGHSFGGFTTYALASGFSNELGSVEADPRVDAIIPLAPASNGLDDERLASISIPSLVIVGTNDQTTPVDPNVTRPWDLIAQAPQFRLELVDGAHNTFTDLCAYLEFFPTLPSISDVVLEAIESQANEGCGDSDMAIPRAQDLTNTFALTFLDAVFNGGEMILPDNFEIPEDINYQVQ